MDSEQETQAPAATEGSQPSNESESSAENALEYGDLTVEIERKTERVRFTYIWKNQILLKD